VQPNRRLARIDGYSITFGLLRTLQGARRPRTHPVEGLREAPDAPSGERPPGNLIQLLINMQLLNGVITLII
jgi:hypothetical protein